MFNREKHKQAGQSMFMTSMQGLADTLAVIATFIGTGPLHSAMEGWVMTYTAVHYDESMTDMASMALWPACFFVIFFGARASISTALMFGAVAVMTRFI